jgi:hypothetical protein
MDSFNIDELKKGVIPDSFIGDNLLPNRHLKILKIVSDLKSVNSVKEYRIKHAINILENIDINNCLIDGIVTGKLYYHNGKFRSTSTSISTYDTDIVSVLNEKNIELIKQYDKYIQMIISEYTMIE